jgi:hypothetical protein
MHKNVRSSIVKTVLESIASALFVWTYQQNQQSSSSVFLSQQTSEQCFQHNKPAKRTGCSLRNCREKIEEIRMDAHMHVSVRVSL